MSSPPPDRERRGWRSLLRRLRFGLRPRPERPVTAPAPNLLVISDLHLGEDIKPARNIAYLRRLVGLERKLCQFLDHYRVERRSGRPWRLIINGDMVDFMHVHLVPEDWGDDPDVPHSRDHRLGMGTAPQAVDRKLERVLERHPSVFQRLARFIAAGNDLVIIAGNHDVEFHWPQAQESFKERLAGLVAPEAREKVMAGISFYPWFYCEQGLVYIEHGHQYDASASWDSLLDPRKNHVDDELELNLSSASIRYFANLNPNLDPHGKSDWGAIDAIAWSLRQGVRRSLRIGYHYAYLSWRLLCLWRQYGHEGRVRRRALHLERLHEMAERFGLPADVVLQLDDLRRRPITATLWGVLRVLFIDRVIILGIASIASVAALLTLPLMWAVAVPAALVPGAIALGEVLGRRRELDPARWLPATAEKIRRSVQVPVVVFGHTHNATQLPLEEGGWYFNTGTWIDGQEAGDGVPFTHLIIEQREARIEASLCQWEGKSVPLFDAPGAVIPTPRAADMGAEPGVA